MLFSQEAQQRQALPPRFIDKIALKPFFFIPFLLFYVLSPLRSQETYHSMDFGEGPGGYFSQVLELYPDSSFHYMAHTQIRTTVGMGSYQKIGLKLHLQFDSLSSPRAFPQEDTLHNGKVHLALHPLTQVADTYQLKVIYQQDTIPSASPVAYPLHLDFPLEMDYHGGPILLQDKFQKLELHPDQAEVSSYLIFWQRPYLIPSIVSGAHITLNQTKKGYMRSYWVEVYDPKTEQVKKQRIVDRFERPE